jgi:hypothetical protein
MQPAVVFPFHDPDGRMYPHLQAILPELKLHFERAYICPPPSTLQQSAHMQELEADPFFRIFRQEAEMQIGERFAFLYQHAAEAAPAGQVLHLCYLDRLAFAMETDHCEHFLADIDATGSEDVPLIFQRSEAAWQTHPVNYQDIEGLVTIAGRHLFGRDLDYAWCHLAVRAGQLRAVMPGVRNPDLSMVAEMIFHLQENIRTKDVDWLAWEDPFIMGRDADELRHERESDRGETHKRLGYAVRMLDTLDRLSRNQGRQVV